jgi:hypothetical protein
VSADRAGTLGLTRADIQQALTDTPIDEPTSLPHPSKPRFERGATPIGGLDTPAHWIAFGEGGEQQ